MKLSTCVLASRCRTSGSCSGLPARSVTASITLAERDAAEQQRQRQVGERGRERRRRRRDRAVDELGHVARHRTGEAARARCGFRLGCTKPPERSPWVEKSSMRHAGSDGDVDEHLALVVVEPVLQIVRVPGRAVVLGAAGQMRQRARCGRRALDHLGKEHRPRQTVAVGAQRRVVAGSTSPSNVMVSACTEVSPAFRLVASATRCCLNRHVRLAPPVGVGIRAPSPAIARRWPKPDRALVAAVEMRGQAMVLSMKIMGRSKAIVAAVEIGGDALELEGRAVDARPEHALAVVVRRDRAGGLSGTIEVGRDRRQDADARERQLALEETCRRCPQLG